MFSLHIFHFHFADSPESLYFLNVVGIEHTMQLVQFVIVFHVCSNKAILSYP